MSCARRGAGRVRAELRLHRAERCRGSRAVRAVDAAAAGGVLAAPAGAGCSRCALCEVRDAAVVAESDREVAHPTSAGAVVRCTARYPGSNRPVHRFIPDLRHLGSRRCSSTSRPVNGVRLRRPASMTFCGGRFPGAPASVYSCRRRVTYVGHKHELGGGMGPPGRRADAVRVQKAAPRSDRGVGRVHRDLAAALPAAERSGLAHAGGIRELLRADPRGAGGEVRPRPAPAAAVPDAAGPGAARRLRRLDRVRTAGARRGPRRRALHDPARGGRRRGEHRGRLRAGTPRQCDPGRLAAEHPVLPALRVPVLPGLPHRAAAGADLRLLAPPAAGRRHERMAEPGAARPDLRSPRERGDRPGGDQVDPRVPRLPAVLLPACPRRDPPPDPDRPRAAQRGDPGRDHSRHAGGGGILAGAVITETVFSRQGLGRVLQNGVLSQDIPLVQGVVVLSAVLFVLTSFLVDLVYPLLDPRIRRV